MSASSSNVQGCEGLMFTGYKYPYINMTTTESFVGG